MHFMGWSWSEVMDWCIGVSSWSGTFEEKFGVEQKTQINQSQLILDKIQRYIGNGRLYFSILSMFILVYPKLRSTVDCMLRHSRPYQKMSFYWLCLKLSFLFHSVISPKGSTPRIHSKTLVHDSTPRLQSITPIH